MYDFLLGSILNMALSCIIYEIKRDIGRKSRFFIPNLHSTPLLGGPTSEYRRKIWRRNTRMVGLPDGEKSLLVSIQYTNVTDTQPDRQMNNKRRTTAQATLFIVIY